MKSVKPKVLVFGTFDGIHKGHIHFLRQASKLGELIVSVSSNRNVILLKHKKPLFGEKTRKQEVLNLNIAKEVRIGERKIESWNIIKKIKPNIIAIGYDQKKLKIALTPIARNLDVRMVTLSSIEPKKYHSSILNK